MTTYLEPSSISERFGNNKQGKEGDHDALKSDVTAFEGLQNVCTEGRHGSQLSSTPSRSRIDDRLKPVYKGLDNLRVADYDGGRRKNGY